MSLWPGLKNARETWSLPRLEQAGSSLHVAGPSPKPRLSCFDRGGIRPISLDQGERRI